MCFRVTMCIKINTNLFNSQGLSTWSLQHAQELTFLSPGRGCHGPSTFPVCSSCPRVWVRTAHSKSPWNEWDLSPHPLLHSLTLQMCCPLATGLASTERGTETDNTVSFPLLKLRAGENSPTGWQARPFRSANWLLRLKWHLCLIRQVILYIYVLKWMNTHSSHFRYHAAVPAPSSLLSQVILPRKLGPVERGNTLQRATGVSAGLLCLCPTVSLPWEGRQGSWEM